MLKFIQLTLVGMLLLLTVSCDSVAPLVITLVADGESRTLTTDAQTVADLLAQSNITLDADDRVTPSENTFLANDMTVRVIRVEIRTETEQEIIPYSRETIRDATIPLGETRLLRAGTNGIEETTYAVTLEDGQEVSRRIVQQTTRQEAENEVILIGAYEEVTAIPISGTISYISTSHNAWVMRTATGNRRRLTTTGDLDGRVFDLSPDGSWLIFTRAATETLNTFWLLDTVTAGAEPIRLRMENILWAAWAPDGSQIAYSTGTPREAPPGWEATNDLHLATPRPQDGMLIGRRRVLPPSAGGTQGWWGTTYVWNPDGESLAYARADEIGIVRLYDNRATTLTRFAAYRTRAAWAWTPNPVWSPEGGFITTIIHGPPSAGEMPEDSPIFDLFVLGVTEPLTAELAAEVGMWAIPSFSPDGNHITYGQARIPYASQNSSYDLYLIDRDGSDRQRLFPQDTGEAGLDYPEVTWDPWGEQFLVVYQQDLYLLTTEGQIRRVTDDGAITTVRWSGIPESASEEE